MLYRDVLKQRVYDEQQEPEQDAAARAAADVGERHRGGQAAAEDPARERRRRPPDAQAAAPELSDHYSHRGGREEEQKVLRPADVEDGARRLEERQGRPARPRPKGDAEKCFIALILIAYCTIRELSLSLRR